MSLANGDSYDCGAEALQAISQYYGQSIDLETLADELYVPGVDGTFPQRLSQVARQHGFVSRVVEGSAPALRNAIRSGVPAVIMIRIRDQANHYLLPTAYHPDQGWFVFEFYKGFKWIFTEEELEKAWQPCGFMQLEFVPDALAAQRDRARALEELGNSKEAINLYQAILAGTPGDIPSRIGLGNCFAMEGEFSNARREYLLGWDAGSRDPELLNNLADVCLQLGETDARVQNWAQEAVLAYSRLFDLEEPGLKKTLHGRQLALALGTLGSVDLARGEIGAARKSFRQSLDLLGSNEPELRTRRLEQIAKCEELLKAL